MVGLEKNDVIKDKSTENLIESGLTQLEGKETVISDAISKKINEKVEKARLKFLKSDEYKNAEDGKEQEAFNKFLDEKVEPLLEDGEIELLDENIANFKEALHDLDFEINLDEYAKMKEQAVVDINLPGSRESIPCSKNFSNEDLISLIDKINGTTFTNKRYIFDCLKEGGRENVRRIQYLLIDEPYEKGQPPKRKNPLLLYGTDGTMGEETYNALNKYIDENEWGKKVKKSDERKEVAGNNNGETQKQKEKGRMSKELNEYVRELNELNDDDINNIKEIIGDSDLDGVTLFWNELETIPVEIATILSKTKATIYLEGLEKLDLSVLNKFLADNSTCTVYFKEGYYIQTNAKDEIRGIYNENNEKYNESNADFCKLLGIQVVPEINTVSEVEELSSIQGDINVEEPTTYGSPEFQHLDNSQLGESKIIIKADNNQEQEEKVKMSRELTEYVRGLNELNEGNVSKIKEIIGNSDLDGVTLFWNELETIPVEIATILSKTKATIYLGGLNKLNLDVLDEFLNENSTCTVYFKEGYIENRIIRVHDGEKNGVYSGSIDEALCDKLLGISGVSTSVETVTGEDNYRDNEKGNSGVQEQITNEQRVQSNNNAVSTDVRYQPSATMKPEAYERMSIDDEKKAIRALLGTEGLFWGLIGGGRGTEQNSHAKKEYRVRGGTREWENIQDLREILEYYADLKNQVYTLSDCFYVFNTLYTKGKKFSYNDLMLLERKGEDGRYLNQGGRGLFTQLFEKFGGLFTQYKEGKGGRYFRSTMELLEDYFYRGRVSLEDIQSGKAFAKIYEENNLGVAKGGLNVDNLDVQFDYGEGSNDRLGYNEKGEKEFVSLLSDFNLDGRIDNDDSSYYMGLELGNVYKSVNVDLRNDKLSDEVESDQYVWKNIVDFAISYFDAMGDENMVAKLKSANTVDELNAVLKEKEGGKYGTLQSLQSMIKDSPVPPSFIFKYGKRASEMFFNELMTSKDFDEMYDKGFEKLVQQGLDPNVKEKVKPIAYASYINGGAGVGLGVARDAGKIGTFDMSLGATNIGGDGGAVYGIMFGWRTKDFSVGKWKMNTGVNVGNTGSVDAPLVVLWNANTVSGVINEKKLKEIKPVPVKRFTMGLSAGWLGDGLYASLKPGVSRDYIEGVNRMHNELNNYLRNSLKEAFDDEEFKTFFTNGKFDTTKSDEIKAFLRKKLEDGKTDQAVVDAAVDNIYDGLIYFSAGLTFNEKDEESFNIAKNLMIHQLAETYTNIYMSDHIEDNLDGKVKLTNWSIGPAVFFNGNIKESIAKSIYYTVAGSVQFTKYGNTYSEETDQSWASYEARLATGVGFDFLESSVDDGKITQEAITYLNDKLSIVNNPNIPKLEIKDGVLYIPRNLVKWVNIHIDPSLKDDFVKSDDNGFMVPLNTEIALLTNSKTSTTQFDLVIGNYKKVDDAILLNDRSNFEGDPLEYKGKENANGKNFTLDKVNSEMKDLYDREDFPLSTCEKTADGKLVFVLKDGKKISVEDSTLLDNKGNIIVSNYGRLLITKDNNGDYKASFEKWDKEQLMVVYDDGSKISVPLMGEGGVDMGEVYGDGYYALRQNFEEFEEALSKIDDRKWNQYVEFMEEACDVNDGGRVDMNDYSEAFNKVKKLLNDYSEDASLSDIKDIVNNITNDNEKVYVVDRFKMIFALISLSQKNTLSKLRRLASRRKKYYEKLQGYATSGEEFPLKGLDYREKLLDDLGSDLGIKTDPNLIGMTAFYKRGYIDNAYDKLYEKQLDQAYGYSMTEIGSTDYLGKLLPITDNLEGENGVKEWFIKNLNKTEVHKNILKKIIKERVKSEIIDDQLYELLRGDEVSIDNGSKKVKIDVDYVFYLLGECANESIGIKLGNIEISGGGGGNGDGSGNGNEVIINAEASYEGVVGVYSGNKEAANMTVIQPVASFGAAAAVGPTKDAPIDQGYGAITHQEAHVGSGQGTGGTMSGSSNQGGYVGGGHGGGGSGGGSGGGGGH